MINVYIFFLLSFLAWEARLHTLIDEGRFQDVTTGRFVPLTAGWIGVFLQASSGAYPE